MLYCDFSISEEWISVREFHHLIRYYFNITKSHYANRNTSRVMSSDLQKQGLKQVEVTPVLADSDKWQRRSQQSSNRSVYFQRT
jgi:hypothetical protein